MVENRFSLRQSVKTERPHTTLCNVGVQVYIAGSPFPGGVTLSGITVIERFVFSPGEMARVLRCFSYTSFVCRSGDDPQQDDLKVTSVAFSEGREPSPGYLQSLTAHYRQDKHRPRVWGGHKLVLLNVLCCPIDPFGRHAWRLGHESGEVIPTERVQIIGRPSGFMATLVLGFHSLWINLCVWPTSIGYKLP